MELKKYNKKICREALTGTKWESLLFFTEAGIPEQIFIFGKNVDAKAMLAYERKVSEYLFMGTLKLILIFLLKEHLSTWWLTKISFLWAIIELQLPWSVNFLISENVKLPLLKTGSWTVLACSDFWILPVSTFFEASSAPSCKSRLRKHSDCSRRINNICRRIWVSILKIKMKPTNRKSVLFYSAVTLQIKTKIVFQVLFFKI